jgi:DNA topoisomerase I
VRLRRSVLTGPGLRRVRRGKGFAYRDDAGHPVDAETKERIQALVIPPAWRDVWIAPHANAHIQAVGTDDAGRRQYLYHPAWRNRRDQQKFDEMAAFARLLPEVRRTTAALLRKRSLCRERVLAGAVCLLDRGFFRIGGDEYAEENGSYGLSTFERRHVHVTDGMLVFDYAGKTGKRQVREIVDPALYRVAGELKHTRRRSPRFLAYREGRRWVDVRAQDINAFLKELTGADFTAKTFRTWHATVLAAVALAEAPHAGTVSGTKRVLAGAVAEVAEALGNTPAVCRASYIDPRVFDRYRAGSTIEPQLAAAARNGSARRLQPEIEAAVLHLLGIGS